MEMASAAGGRYLGFITYLLGALKNNGRVCVYILISFLGVAIFVPMGFTRFSTMADGSTYPG